jgi:hypothetical protein
MRYGIRLLPELYSHLNPTPYTADSTDAKGFGGRFATERVHGHGRALRRPAKMHPPESLRCSAVPVQNSFKHAAQPGLEHCGALTTT